MPAQALRKEPLTVYGDGQQTRSFQYVSDLVRVLQFSLLYYLLLIRKLIILEGYTLVGVSTFYLFDL